MRPGIRTDTVEGSPRRSLEIGVEQAGEHRSGVCALDDVVPVMNVTRPSGVSGGVIPRTADGYLTLPRVRTGNRRESGHAPNPF